MHVFNVFSNGERNDHVCLSLVAENSFESLLAQDIFKI